MPTKRMHTGSMNARVIASAAPSESRQRLPHLDIKTFRMPVDFFIPKQWGILAWSMESQPRLWRLKLCTEV